MADPVVLHLALANARGGAEAVVETLVRHARRYRAAVAVPNRAEHLPRWRAEGFRILEVPPLPQLRDVVALRQYIRALAGVITGEAPAIVHTHGVAAQLLGGRAAARTGRPVLWHLHDCFEARWTPDGLLHRVALRARRDGAVAVSETVRRSWQARLTGTHLVRVYNGVAADITPLAERTPEPLVVWCGRLQRWKGPDLFLDVAARVVRVCPGVRFAVVGGTMFGMERDLPTELRLQARRLGLDGAITWVGQVSDARPWLAAADVVVHTARAPEPFGLVLVEAMVQSRPVVAFDQGGPAEIVDPGTTGLLVSPLDVGAMAEAVVDLLLNPERRRRLGQAGAERARAAFSVSGMVEGVESAYDRLRTLA